MRKIRIIAMLLALALFFPVFASAADDAFSDVPTDHPYAAAIDFCAAKGFVKGVGGGMFEPDAPLTRAQFAAMWARSLQFNDENPGFNDISRLNQYYDTSIIVLYAKGIINGVSDTRYAPDEGISREQMALIAMRTYELGVADNDDYTFYSDSDLINTWARDGVSSCLNNGLFNGLYTGPVLNPQKAVTRGEMCKLIYNINQPAHAITIDPEMAGGTVTADRNVARAGVTVTLTIEPDENMRLKAGTLRVDSQPIDGSTFIMPDNDVIIHAQFEEKPILESIRVEGTPDTEFAVGDTLEFSDLVIMAEYTNHDEQDVTDSCTFEPALGTELDAEGTQEVRIVYTESGITVETTITINVTEAPDTSPEVSEEPEASPETL